MFKKILTFLFVILTIIFSSFSVASVSAQVSDARYQELKDLAIQMITPSYGDLSDSSFQKETRLTDNELFSKIEALPHEEQEIVMRLIQNNGEEFSIRSLYRSMSEGGRCGYQVFPNKIWAKDFLGQGNVDIHYGDFTSNISNNPNGEFPCDNQIWYSTSKPYVWGTTPRARALLGKYNNVILKRTDFGKDSLILGGFWSARYYGLNWFDMHTEIVIWGY